MLFEKQVEFMLLVVIALLIGSMLAIGIAWLDNKWRK